jgi:TRAP transporter TAXI family solute receptor
MKTSKIIKNSKLYTIGMLFAVLLLVSSLVVGCGGSETVESGKDQSAGGNAKEVKRISIATASTSGAWYPLGGAWASVISKYVPGIEATAEVGAASIENVRKLNEGNVELAFLQPDVAYNAYTGSENFKDVKMDSIRALFANYAVVAHIVTTDPEIKSIKDFAGKRVGVGAPGSGNEVTSRTILEVNGLTYDDIDEQFLSFPEMINAIKDNQLDVAIGTMPVPTGILVDLNLQHQVKLIPMDESSTNKFLEKNPFFLSIAVPANSYSGIDQDTQTVAFRGVVYGTTRLSDEEAYEIVKAVWEHRDEWKDVHSVAKGITLDIALEGVPSPLHPGAVKFYKEKGITIPDQLLPPEMK